VRYRVLHSVNVVARLKGSVCCSVLQCVAVCCSVLQFVTVRSSVVQCVAVCFIVRMQRQGLKIQCVAVCCSVLQCVAVCYSVLQSAS